MRRALVAIATVLFYCGLLGVSVHATFGDSATRGANDEVALGTTKGDPGGDAGTEQLGASGDASVGGVEPSVGDGGSSIGSAATPGGSRTTTTLRRSTSTTKPIVIGIHDDNTTGAGEAYGVKGLPTSQMPWVNEVVDWINKNGGMGGRRLEVVAHVTENLNGSFDQQAQDACTDFTEDHHVVAVVGGAKIPTLNLVDCLAKHKTPLVWDYHFMPDGPTLDRYGDYLYMPTMVRLERMGVWIDAIADRGFLKNTKIGLVRYDEPLSKRLTDQVIKPRLAAHGLQLTDEAAFSPATSAASSGDISAQSNSTIVRFRSQGIDRVLFAPTAGVMPLLFLTSAQRQGYHPRFSFTSYDIPAFQTENNAPELAGSEVFGWLPAGDVAQPQQPPLNPTAKLCVTITHDATPPANGSIRRFCDGLMFLKSVFDHGAEPTPAGIRRVADSFGSSWESPWTFKATLGPARHDGASVGRVAAFDGGCSCFVYTGPDVPIP